MRFARASGVLLHPTSLSGPTGIGELGPAARRFVDFLASAGQTLWQILPLGPTGAGNSPYACYSAFAGNPMMLSLELLVEEGLLSAEDLEPAKAFAQDRVDFGAVVAFRDKVLNLAFQNFRQNAAPADRHAFREWTEDEDNARWLEDYALFMALKRAEDGRPWYEWEPSLARRDPRALKFASEKLAEEVWYQRFLQWKFDLQWAELRAYAHKKGIEIVGDIPIYVADDSADVWSQPHLFYLDASGRRTVVAGVPPDYFSETGQLWGNPLYRWEQLERTGYAWWIARLQVLFRNVDRVRLDHFRAFEAYWEIPAAEKTAVNGRWVPGPGARLFYAVDRALGSLPIIAEDLGIITPEVEELRDRFEFPGMKILQFAFGDTAKNPYLPHNYDKNCVVYTGTHDNDTTAGWFTQLKPEEQQKVREYVDALEGDVAWALIRAAMASVADTCVVPAQDLLGLGSEARMNTPAEAEGNWGWRLPEGALTPELAARLKALSERYGRLPAEKPAKKP